MSDTLLWLLGGLAVVAWVWAFSKIRKQWDRDTEEWKATMRRLREVTPESQEVDPR